jgi:hypothetical protein
MHLLWDILHVTARRHCLATLVEVTDFRIQILEFLWLVKMLLHDYHPAGGSVVEGDLCREPVI